MSGKRIILMYISEVSGHHSATKAIEKAVKITSPDAEILNINAFNYTNPLSEKIIHRLYMGVIQKTPRIWSYLYDNPSVVKKLDKIKEAVHRLNAPKLKTLFDQFKPDVIACSQAFPCGMVADFKKTYNIDVPLVGILTDYIPHAYWVYDKVNYYISPCEEVSNRLMQKGVPKEKIRSYGIPIDPKFNQSIDRRLVMQGLKLDPELFTVLIMGGGHGIGPIKNIVKLLNKIQRNFQIIVVTGINKQLANCLKSMKDKLNKNMLILGYIDNINELMVVSDIIITKPGGITTAEALAKKLPMLIVRPIPGQEASNTAYLTKKEAAIKVDNLRVLKRAIEDLLQNPDKLSKLSANAEKIAKPDASLNIANLLLSLCQEGLNG